MLGSRISLTYKSLMKILRSFENRVPGQENRRHETDSLDWINYSDRSTCYQFYPRNKCKRNSSSEQLLLLRDFNVLSVVYPHYHLTDRAAACHSENSKILKYVAVSCAAFSAPPLEALGELSTSSRKFSQFQGQLAIR